MNCAKILAIYHLFDLVLVTCTVPTLLICSYETRRKQHNINNDNKSIQSQ